MMENCIALSSEQRWLVIETSGRNGSVAIGTTERFEVRPLPEGRRHARDLTLAVSELLDAFTFHARDLTGVIVSQGPGSFTGLRVGLMSAKTLAFATGCRLIAVPTFRVIAHQAPDESTSLDVIADAQQAQLYHQRLIRSEPSDDWTTVSDLQIRSIEDWLEDLPEQTWLTGPGVSVYQDRIPPTIRVVSEESRHPRAESLYHVGRKLAGSATAVNWAELEPLYLRGSYDEEQSKAGRPG